uniref:Uncharacterized protein n=1 Tax=Musa acuminata subsp. malaccensis TaxID=214687 RepID=A0A804KFY8_MUSAM
MSRSTIIESSCSRHYSIYTIYMFYKIKTHV